METYWQVRNGLAGGDWEILKADLRCDHFDNGRSPEQLRLSFKRSQATAFAWRPERVVSTACVLSDGVCYAYLLGV